MNASRLPSGDGCGWNAPPSTFVTCHVVRSCDVERVDVRDARCDRSSKNSSVPSGDHVGCMSIARSCVTSSTLPVASVDDEDVAEAAARATPRTRCACRRATTPAGTPDRSARRATRTVAGASGASVHHREHALGVLVLRERDACARRATPPDRARGGPCVSRTVCCVRASQRNRSSKRVDRGGYCRPCS